MTADGFSVAAAGDLGLLIDLPASVDAASAARAARRVDGVAAAVPGHSSLLVLFRRESDEGPGEVLRAMTAASESRTGAAGALHEIPVSFADAHAPDLPRLIARSGLSRSALIEAIAELPLRVRFLGFLPGFAYLDGWPSEWQLPRLDTPRPRVPRGSFAVAGPSAGFYPTPSPGGWNLIGRSGVAFWDAERPAPNLLAPGDRVRVIPSPIDDFPDPVSRRQPDRGEPVADVLRAGTLSLLIGARRERNPEVGAPAGGPFDPEAAAVANRAVGNAPDAAVLECALSGPALRFQREVWLSWSGASAEVRVDGKTVADVRAMRVSPQGVLEIGRLENGARGWLAIRGGFAVASLPGFFPAPLAAGSSLRVETAAAGAAAIRSLVRTSTSEIGAIAGPARLPGELIEAIRSRTWRVTDRLSRAGIRLEGSSPLPSAAPAELPSTPLQFGSVQWHPDGSLVAMGPDHPITGGYLQVMTVRSSERWKLAQLAPGDEVRWRLEPVTASQYEYPSRA